MHSHLALPASRLSVVSQSFAEFPTFETSDFSGDEGAVYFDMVQLECRPDIQRGRECCLPASTSADSETASPLTHGELGAISIHRAALGETR
jgi:hypothetical protein